jgi:hypothetical protein
MLKWERRRILIWGKTRPEISQKYREIVCTGGVFADTKALVRLYPIPLRYLDDTRVFKKYQWIEADVAKAPDDPRPESYRINCEGVEVGEFIPTRKNWAERAPWIIQPQSLFPSVEALQKAQAERGVSLGIVKPATVERVWHEPIPDDEQGDFWDRYERVVSQMDLSLGSERLVKPLTPPDFRFKVRFRCSDPECRRAHVCSALDWELDALYWKQKKVKRVKETAADDVVSKLGEICRPQKDTRFFMGNISNHPQVFTIVGFWWPHRGKPVNQLDLLEPATT